MLRAVLFDSDGVLVDTERPFYEATRTVFAADGAALTEPQWARWYLAEGKRSRDIAGLAGIPAGRVDRVIEDRDKAFWGRIAQGVRVLPGVRRTLRALAERFRLAVVTGASRAHFERVHSSTGLLPYFELVVTSDDCSEAKPSPQAYLTALRGLGLPGRECLAVEDSPRGAASALAAGIRCLVVPHRLTAIELCPRGSEIVDRVDRVIEATTQPSGGVA